ncbi:hypothetical protein VZT92_003516 [Zoarces viviparus]|uniref:Ig-like domain-containing protein n=1 Tax=Zoarces viviparus TaxID=48416 RepID=A0AAW1FTR5_ZOAVI
MLSLPAAALCCLCSALGSMAAELIQKDLTLTRRVGGKVSFSCGGTDQCDGSYVYWYQKRDNEAFTLILDISRSSGYIYKGYNHHQKDDFSAVNKQNSVELEIQNVGLSHSASYYCSCWRDDLHSERRFLQPEQKATDEQMSALVTGREQQTTAQVHVPPPSATNTLMEEI